MKRVSVSVGMVLIALCFLLVEQAPAQMTRGSLSGTVQDPSRGVIIGVRVAVVNSATGLSRETATNSFGIYRFAAIEPGVYQMEFTSRGFDTVKLERVEVNANQEVVINPTLPVGAAVTAVEVNQIADGVELTKAAPTV